MFFVYGTLLPGQPNAHYWGDSVMQITAATLHNATLYDMGSYPMLIGRPNSSVQGALVTVHPDRYDALLVQLDRLETYNPDDHANSMYVRMRRTVVTASGARVKAWVYVGKEKYVRGMEPLGGDWIAYAAANQTKITAWWQQFNADPDASLI